MVGIQYKYRETRLYRYQRDKRLEKEYRERTEREEMLKGLILEKIYQEFILNVNGAKMDSTVREADFQIPREYEETLREIIKHKEFIEYHLTIVECNRDLLLSFKNIPIKLRIKKKFLGGDED
jgi:hypothetical protein